MKKKDLAIEFAAWLMMNGYTVYHDGDMGGHCFALTSDPHKRIAAEHLYHLFLTEQEEQQ